MSGRRLRIDDFDYELPPAAIAQSPAEPRDSSRLLVADFEAGATPPALRHRAFHEIAAELRPGDLLVVNDTRVLPARLRGTRPGGGRGEVLLLRAMGDRRWEALVRPSRRLPPGARITFPSGDGVEVGERLTDTTRAVRFDRDPESVMARSGEMPLPPYIHGRTADPDRYQTVYARTPGSAAAPTAGLHFTAGLLARLESAGVRRASVTLHVGLDTFRPLEGTFVDEHRIHREWYEVGEATRRLVTDTRGGGGRVIAVGTTTVRVLETAARSAQDHGWTDLYITPPHAFAAVDGMVTNFHLPRSSLLLLVAAFVQWRSGSLSPLEARDALLRVYGAALTRGYRFFSFGDAMLIC
ncbi:MAG: tRNA preQ1(34) S-adenosylmethionine ribosyltransferase-isomerase QueA [Candidatus Limnocylindria bacterium]